MCKRFTEQEGQLTPTKSGFPLLFDVSTVGASSLGNLAQALVEIERDHYRCVISGALADGVEPKGVRRKRVNFEPTAHRWIMLDIDGVELPEGVAPIPANTKPILEATISTLPPEFSGVDCYYQFSGSMGIKSGIRVHLWYWLSRPVSDEEKRVWLAEAPVDKALFNIIQIHFTANPMFEGGAVDPFPARSGLYQAGQGTSEVAVPSDLQMKAERSLRVGRSDGRGGGIHEIVRDPDTGLAIDGREQVMFDLSNEVMFELCAGGSTPTVEDITDRLWERFGEEADLNHVNERGRWTRADAERYASRRHDELVSGVFTFQARDRSIALVPSGPSPYETTTVSAEEGQAELHAALGRFFADVDGDRTPRDLIRITMGSGKTKGTITKLKAFLANRTGQLIEVYVPRHDLIEEWEDALLGGDGGAVNAEVVHIKPRTGGSDLRFEPLCDRADYVRDLERKGHSVFPTACLGGDEGEACDFIASCRYLSQFSLPGPSETRSVNVIRLYVHDYLGLPRNEIERQVRPDLVVIDENPLSTLAAQDTFPTVTFDDIATHLKTDDAPDLGRQMLADLYGADGPQWLALLRRIGVSGGQLEAIGRQIPQPEVMFDRSRTSSANVASASHARGLRALVQVLREELRFKDRDQPERLVLNEDKSGVVVCLARECRNTDQEPLLVLDATASSPVAEKLFGPLRESRITIRQRAFVTQVYDRTGSNTSWNRKVEEKDSHEDVTTLIKVLKGWAEYGAKPLVVSHKALADYLRETFDENSGIAIAHFQALRGSNEYEDCDVVFITGRNAPPFPAVDQQGRALFWDDPIPLQHDDLTNRLPQQLVGYWLGERLPQQPQAGVYVEDFTDARLAALNEQVRHAETAQAIARLRLVWTRSPKRVFLLGNLPVEMPVDRLVGFDELMPDRLERELIETGDIPLTAAGMMKMRPDLFPSVDAARMALKRSLVSSPARLLSFYPELARATLTVARFHVKGTRGWQEHLFLAKDVRGDNTTLVWRAVPDDERQEYLERGWGVGKVQDLKQEEVFR